MRPSSFLLAAGGAAVLLAPALALVPGPPPGAPFYPSGDHAVLELYTRLAADGAQRLGPYSRFHFHHPGPALFYLSVPAYEILGRGVLGLRVAALLLNSLSIAGMLFVAHRLAGLVGYLATALGLALFVAWWGAPGLLSYWNPTVAVLPFGLAVLAFGAVAAGRAAFLPAAVLAVSFAAQTHVGCAPVALAVVLTSVTLAGTPPLRRALGLPALSRRAWLPPLLGAGAAAALAWALPIAEQLDPEGGNLGRILVLAGQAPRRHSSWAEAARALAENAAPFLTGGASSVPGPTLLFLLLAMALLVGLLRSWRTGRAAGLGLGLVALAGLAAALYATTRIPGGPQPYLLGWMAMLGLSALLAAAVGLAPAPGEGTARGGRAVAVAIVLLVAGLALRGVRISRDEGRHAPPPPDHLSEWIRLLAEPAVPALRASGARRIRVDVERDVPRAVAVGLLLALDKAGVPIAITRFGPFRFEGRMAPDGREDATLQVGAESSAWTDWKGARMLARVGGVFLYLLPGRPPPAP